MMILSRTARRIAVTAVAAALLAVAGGTAASAASAASPTTASPTTASTWTLVDLGQRICASSDDPRTLYYYVDLYGTWSVPITAGFTGMPAGAEVSGPFTVQPGSGDGHKVQQWVTFRLSGATPGHHVPRLWATDGTVTQSAPVVLDIQSSC